MKAIAFGRRGDEVTTIQRVALMPLLSWLLHLIGISTAENPNGGNISQWARSFGSTPEPCHESLSWTRQSRMRSSRCCAGKMAMFGWNAPAQEPFA